MMLLIPLIIYSGTSISFWTGMITPIIMLQVESDPQINDIDQNEKFKLSLLAMIAFGCGEFVGSYLLGYISDKFNSKRATFFIIFLMLTMLIFTLMAIQSTSYGILTYMMTFTFGL